MEDGQEVPSSSSRRESYSERIARIKAEQKAMMDEQVAAAKEQVRAKGEKWRKSLEEKEQNIRMSYQEMVSEAKQRTTEAVQNAATEIEQEVKRTHERASATIEQTKESIKKEAKNLEAKANKFAKDTTERVEKVGKEMNEVLVKGTRAVYDGIEAIWTGIVWVPLVGASMVWDGISWILTEARKAIEKGTRIFFNTVGAVYGILKEGAKAVLGKVKAIWDGIKWIPENLAADIYEAVWEGRRWIATKTAEGVERGQQIYHNGVRWVRIVFKEAMYKAFDRYMLIFDGQGFVKYGEDPFIKRGYKGVVQNDKMTYVALKEGEEAEYMGVKAHVLKKKGVLAFYAIETGNQHDDEIQAKWTGSKWIATKDSTELNALGEPVIKANTRVIRAVVGDQEKWVSKQDIIEDEASN